MTSAGSPCSCGGSVAEPPDAPGWPAGAEHDTLGFVFLYFRLFAPHIPNTHSLDAFFVDADAPEQRLEDFAEGESEEANRAELQTVSHLVQDGRRLRLDLTCSHARLFGNLKRSEKMSSGRNKKEILVRIKKGRGSN